MDVLYKSSGLSLHAQKEPRPRPRSRFHLYRNHISEYFSTQKRFVNLVIALHKEKTKSQQVPQTHRRSRDMAQHQHQKLLSTVLVLALATVVTSPAHGYEDPPPGLGRPFEQPENRTMDDLITSMLGGVNVASHLIMADSRNILAELDMFLSEEQFLGLYEPPKADDMRKMGMLPAPLGSPLARDESYFYDFADSKGKVRTKRKAVRDVLLRWTDGVLPYTFAPNHFSLKEEYMMRRSMTEWERYTCMKFHPAAQTDKNSVRFQNGVGCNSQLGMVGGVQILNLQAPGCRYKGLYLHEIGHALGLVHEHQLPDRDNYIEILYHNVSPHMRVWFNKYATKQVNQRDVPYEYSSVMHYGITAFSKDGSSQTISAKDKEKEKTIGKVYLKELAYTDVMIVNRMYNCSSHCGDEKRCGPNGHLDQNCNCLCRDGSSDCDVTKRRVDRSCRNSYDSWSCYIWANQGECERNEYYMKQKCAKACGLCGSQDEDTEETDDFLWPWQWFPMFTNMMPREWTKLGTCKDKYTQSKCAVWKKRGDCVTNSRWMKINCKATCDLCGDVSSRPAVQCEDTYTESHKCTGWALGGECQVNKVWMFNNCRKSCLLCDKKTVDGDDDGDGVDEDKLTCDNTHHSCQQWASRGECRNNPTWMIPNCRKACQKCNDGTCKNLYDDVQCEIWAQKFRCIQEPEWMATHCAKSCKRGLCENDKGGVTLRPTRRPTTTTTTTTTQSPRTRRPTARPPRPTRPTARPQPTRPTTVDPTCRNKHSSDMECDIWAKNDHCNINPQWMLKFCAKACGECSSGTNTDRTGTGDGDGEETDCTDNRAECAAWAEHGFCDRNPGFNLIECKKSCNNCNGCRDAEFLCSVWAKSGNCERNPSYMLRYCQKSCNICSKSKTERSDETEKDSKGLQGEKDFNKSSRHCSSIFSVFGSLTLLTTLWLL
ncbi:hypothetical protein RRG08_013836 [Elysia crispata]|uniref:Metalloendopeptidase n=1 Tax=Elysia crispata TaxID=231223 RepID=A0AAE0YWU4_9GAST|nr:hypothetical protein RRG08_013836 [Elysia crispata]